jgi:hypothetical protein
METFSSKVEFIRKSFGEVLVARDSENVAVKCPNCSAGSKKKFSISVSTWNCHCWVCGIKGKDLSIILSKYVCKELSEEYRQRFLNGRSLEKQFKDTEEQVHLPKGFVPLCLQSTSRDPDIKDCISYLFNRGLSWSDFWYFKLGAVTTGKFRRRVIIPSFDFTGDLNYFSSRAIDDDSFLKYINSKAKKKTIIFNELNIDWKREITIVEGPFDLFKCNYNSTCLLGSSLGKDSYLFKRIVSNKSPVLLSLDSDMRKKSARIADLLSKYGCRTRILDLGDYSDVGEMSKEEFSRRRESASIWTRESSIMEKISSIRTGSLF